MPDTPDRRSVIVTGASRGIGRGIALRLAQDGLNVTVNDLSSNEGSLSELVKEVESFGVAGRAATGDVSSRDDVERVVADHVSEFGGLDVIVANAGIAITAEFVDTTLQDLQRTLAINVGGVFNCYKAASKVMIEQGRGGRLIAAGSVSAHRGGHWQSAYVASKFAVRGLTQTVATELGKYGITANIYSPGVVQTPMWDSIDDVVTTHEGTPRGSQLAKMLPNIPLGRLSVPADVAAVVSFLASADSAYVTGQSFVVDGGMYFV
jgi:meso-butanediol dehydrogenase / (S,S)-butanediol dehydrogenase / diacetyl reductase